MNREIKFRIWANNKFYYKCLVGNTNNTNDEKWTCPMVWLEKQKEWVHCDNGIICQFTGLHDKNKEEIYEGDIVKITENTLKHKIIQMKPIIAEITWSEEYLTYILITTSVKDAFESLADYLDEYDIEVIGNIYENKELLGGE